jgi:hypothetical protein
MSQENVEVVRLAADAMSQRGLDAFRRGRKSSRSQIARVQLPVAQIVAHPPRPDGDQGAESLVRSDGEGQNRTADTTIFSRVLYQLSYLARGA